MGKRPVFREIRPTKAMVEAARRLNMGGILVVYQDGKTIRMETELNGPYVWRNQKWRIMQCPLS